MKFAREVDTRCVCEVYTGRLYQKYLQRVSLRKKFNWEVCKMDFIKEVNSFRMINDLRVVNLLGEYRGSRKDVFEDDL